MSLNEGAAAQADAGKPDQQELINVEGRLINYLVDCITSGRERDQAYAAILLARLLTHVSPRSPTRSSLWTTLPDPWRTGCCGLSQWHIGLLTCSTNVIAKIRRRADQHRIDAGCTRIDDGEGAAGQRAGDHRLAGHADVVGRARAAGFRARVGQGLLAGEHTTGSYATTSQWFAKSRHHDAG